MRANRGEPRCTYFESKFQLLTLTAERKPETGVGKISNSLHKTYSDCYEAPGS
jgi:hypothetical protein